MVFLGDRSVSVLLRSCLHLKIHKKTLKNILLPLEINLNHLNFLYFTLNVMNPIAVDIPSKPNTSPAMNTPTFTTETEMRDVSILAILLIHREVIVIFLSDIGLHLNISMVKNAFLIFDSKRVF